MSMCMDIKKYFIAFVLMYVGFSEASESFFSYQALRPDHPLDRVDMKVLDIKARLLLEDAKKREDEVRRFEEKMYYFKVFVDDISLLEGRCKPNIDDGHNEAVCEDVRKFYDKYNNFFEERENYPVFEGYDIQGSKVELVSGAMSYFSTIRSIFRRIKDSDFNFDLIHAAIGKEIPSDINDVTLNMSIRIFLAFCKGGI